MIDMNDAPLQKDYELIPGGTIARARLTLQKDDRGYLIHESKKSDGVRYLRGMFELSEDPYVGRRVYTNIGIAGSEEFVNMGKSHVRAMLEATKGIKPDDMSEEAKRARRIDSYQELDGLMMLIRVSVRTDPTGQYAPKNDVSKIITPDCREYVRL